MEVTPVQFRSLGAHRNVPMPVPNLTRIPPDPHVSCLCVTENRQAFMPWLLWNFDRQTWRKRELIIVDSSDPPVQIPKRRDIRVLRVPTGTSLGKKRNVALEAARGQVIAWFDDDDWQHPARLSTLVPLLREHARKLGACFIGPSHSYFLDLYSGYCQTYKVDGYAIFNGSVYYKDEVAFARFPENVLRTEDTQWISSILRSRKGAALTGEHPLLFLWLAHHVNISNERTTRRCTEDFRPVLRAIGRAWGDTQQQLLALRNRLALQPARRAVRAERLEGPRPMPRNSTTSPTVVTASATSAFIARRNEVTARPRPAGAMDKNWAASAVVERTRSFAVMATTAGEHQKRGFELLSASKSRFGWLDALIAAVPRRGQQWSTCEYVGIIDATWLRDGGWNHAKLSARLGQNRRHVDAYFCGSCHRGSVRRYLQSQSPKAEELFQYVLGQRMGKSAQLLDCQLDIFDSGVVAHPHLLVNLVRDWLLPARARLNDQNDLELRAILAGKSLEIAGSAVLATLLPLFLHLHRCSVAQWEASPRMRQGAKHVSSSVIRHIEPKEREGAAYQP